MKIAITGTHGIPNRYGGFEAFAEKLSGLLVSRGHTVIVYTPESHPWQQSRFNGVDLVPVPFNEKRFGTAASLFYDRQCFKDVVARKPDIILNCGTPGAFFIRKRSFPPVVTLTDGLEWQRKKWNFPGKMTLRKAEKTAVSKSIALVADHPVMKNYFYEKYGIWPVYIPYGTDIPSEEMSENRFNETCSPNPALRELHPGNYFLMIARIEPENNIDLVAEGFLRSGTNTRLVIVGDMQTQYGRKMYKRYGKSLNIHFPGSIYDQTFLNLLRHFSKGYFHGHSVGGTNPSLLEAMAAGCLVAAHKNPFNRYILGDNSPYFISAYELADVIVNWDKTLTNKRQVVSGYLSRLRNEYNWERSSRAYLDLFERVVNSR